MDIANRSQYPSAPFLLPSMDVSYPATSTHPLGPSGPTHPAALSSPPLSTRCFVGLQTPPPEMTSSQSYPQTSYVYNASQPKQFTSNSQIPTVPKITDSFKHTQQPQQQTGSSLQKLSSPLPRHDYTNQQIRREDNNSNRSSPSMTVPSSVHSSKGNLQDFAAQVSFLMVDDSS